MKIEWTKEFCYFLGIIWSDASIKREYIRLEIVKDDGELIYDDLCKIGFLKVNKYYRNRKNRKPQISINVMNVKFYDQFLSNYDYTNKSMSSPVKIINDIPSELRRYFYLGLIDGDGCFYISKNKKTKHFYITSNYDQDWTYMNDIFIELDIKMHEVRRVIAKNGNKSSYIRIKKYDEIKKLYNYLYPNGYEIGFKRKYQKCVDIINNPPSYSNNTEKLVLSNIIEMINENKTIMEISKIEKCNWRKIYDFIKNNNVKYNKGFFVGVK